MPDICDQSDKSIEDVLNASIASVKKPPAAPNRDPQCEECGEPIDARRMQLGYVTCIDCAMEQERIRQHFAGGSHGAH